MGNIVLNTLMAEFTTCTSDNLSLETSFLETNDGEQNKGGMVKRYK